MTDSNSSETEGFEAFDLHSNLMRGIRALSFKTPRPIQADTIPAALDGRDILGLAPTGTGKTAAFAIPILDILLDEPVPGPTALILAPTRELASQIDAEIRALARYTQVLCQIAGASPPPHHRLAKRAPAQYPSCSRAYGPDS